MKTKIFLALVLSSTLSWAYPSNLNQLKEKTNFLLHLLNSQEGSALTENDGLLMERNLDKMIFNLRNGTGYPHPNPPSYPPPSGPNNPAPLNFVKAECHIDDDPQFDYGQKVEVIESYSIAGLISDCRELARMSYGQNGSSGLKNIQILASVPPYFQTAECNIDDDPQFDMGQNVIGTIAASSVIELVNVCQDLASMAYGQNGSSGLKNLNSGRTTPAGMKSAECWLDDDPQFDAGQNFAGLVWGYSISDLGQQCSSLAQATYRGNGSSGLRNIRN